MPRLDNSKTVDIGNESPRSVGDNGAITYMLDHSELFRKLTVVENQQILEQAEESHQSCAMD